MSGLTVGALRKLLEGVPDDLPIISYEMDHVYSSMWSGHQSTATLDTWDQYHRDYDPDGEIGERTDFGVRRRVFIIE